MSNYYINNSDIYQVNAERDISIILSKFNSEAIYDMIDNSIEFNMSTSIMINRPNLIRSLEDNFIMMQNQYPDDKQNILQVRDQTYNEIIHYLCNKFNLRFNDNENVDIFSAAFYLYEFLVGSYLYNISTFFTRFIMEEKNNLYKGLNLEKYKKASSINYNKKIIKDSILSTIIINISPVIDSILLMDIEFENIVNMVYYDNNVAKFINSLFEDLGKFYEYYKFTVNDNILRPNIITNIRLAIQEKSISLDSINFIKDQGGE